MTILSNYVPAEYTCSGSAASFAVSFPFFAAADLTVTLTDTNGVAVAAFLNGSGPYDYAVAGTPVSDTGIYPNGTVTFNANPPAGYGLVIGRATARVQPTAWQNNSSFGAKTLESALDRLELQLQELTVLLNNYTGGATNSIIDVARTSVPNIFTALNAFQQPLAIAAATAAGHAVTKAQLMASAALAPLLAGPNLFAGANSFSQPLTLTPGTLANHAATLGDVAAGRVPQIGAVQVLVSAVTLTAPGATLDSRAMVAGDRFGYFDPTGAGSNAAYGVYIWNGAAAAATRATDADAANEIGYATVTVLGGSLVGKTYQCQQAAAAITLGTTALSFKLVASNDATMAAATAETTRAKAHENDLLNRVVQTVVCTPGPVTPVGTVASGVTTLFGSLVLSAGDVKSVSITTYGAGSGKIKFYTPDPLQATMVNYFTEFAVSWPGAGTFTFNVVDDFAPITLPANSRVAMQATTALGLWWGSAGGWCMELAGDDYSSNVWVDQVHANTAKTLQMSVSILQPKSNMSLLLPPNLYMTEGLEGHLYFDALSYCDPSDVDYRLVIPSNSGAFNLNVGGGGYGQFSNGYWHDEGWAAIPGSGAMATASFSVEARDKFTELLLASASSVVNCTPRATTSRTKKVLVIGDSWIGATNTDPTGTIIKTLRDNSIADGNLTLTFVGTYGTAPYLNDGIGGWSLPRWNQPTTDADKAANHFYNPSTGYFDYAYYLAHTGQPQADVVIIHSGTNEMLSGTIVNDVDADAATDAALAHGQMMANSIHAVSSSILVLFSGAPLTGAKQDSAASVYGAGLSRRRMKRNQIRWNLKLITKWGTPTANLAIIPTWTCIDTINNWNYDTAAPFNTRTSVQIARQRDLPHPESGGGYMQVGDLWFATLKWFYK